MPFTRYLDNALLRSVYGGVAYSPPTTLYIGLSSTQPNAADGSNVTEPSGNGYGRVGVTNNSTNFPIPTVGSTDNANAITFPTSTGAWVGSNPLAYFTVYDAPTGGNLLTFGTIENPQVVNSSGAVISFPAGTLSFALA